MQQASKPGAVRVTQKEAPNQGLEAEFSEDAQNVDGSLAAKDYGGLRTVNDAQGDAGISAVAAAHPRTLNSGLDGLMQPAVEGFTSAQGNPRSTSRTSSRSEDGEGTAADHQKSRASAQGEDTSLDPNEEEQQSSFRSEFAEGLSFAPRGLGSGATGSALSLQNDGERTSVQQSETPAGGEPSESRADVSRLDEKKQAAPIDSRSPQFDRPSDSGPIVSGEPRDEHGSDHQSYGAEEVPLKAPQSVAAPENAPSVSSAHSPAEPLKGELPDEAPSSAAPVGGAAVAVETELTQAGAGSAAGGAEEGSGLSSSPSDGASGVSEVSDSSGVSAPASSTPTGASTEASGGAAPSGAAPVGGAAVAVETEVTQAGAGGAAGGSAGGEEGSGLSSSPSEGASGVSEVSDSSGGSAPVSSTPTGASTEASGGAAPSGAAPDHEDTRGSHENNGWGNDAGDREFHTGRSEGRGSEENNGRGNDAGDREFHTGRSEGRGSEENNGWGNDAGDREFHTGRSEGRGSEENNGWGNDAGDREFHTGRSESAGHDVSDLHAEEFSAQDLGQHDSDGDWLQAIDGGGSGGSELPSDWLECIDHHSDGSKADKKEDLEDASGDHFVRGDEDDGKHHHGSHAA